MTSLKLDASGHFGVNGPVADRCILKNVNVPDCVSCPSPVGLIRLSEMVAGDGWIVVYCAMYQCRHSIQPVSDRDMIAYVVFTPFRVLSGCFAM